MLFQQNFNNHIFNLIFNEIKALLVTNRVSSIFKIGLEIKQFNQKLFKTTIKFFFNEFFREQLSLLNVNLILCTYKL